MGWSFSDIPPQSGRTVIVTGANSGLGLETSRALVRLGATVIMACRNLDKASAARSEIMQGEPVGTAEVMKLDLSDLTSVSGFVENFLARNSRLDLLINNAGVMIPPHSRTPQGFELQMGTNHFGHFALTLPLLPLLLASGEGRVVVVSSLAHRFGKLDVANLSGTKKYRPWKAYGQSKLANLLFCLELKRRLEDMGTPTKVVAAHPGYAATNLQSQSALISIVNPLLGQSPKNGALPVLRAAVDPHVHSGEYYGPRWMFEIFGSPVVVGRSRAARDVDLAQQLWVESEDLTGVRWAEIFPEDRG